MRYVRAAGITLGLALLVWMLRFPAQTAFDGGTRWAPEAIKIIKEASATTLNLPFTFSSGGVIYASQMNANFQAIRAVINALDDQNIANGSITASAKLIDATVTLAKMATGSVDSSKIVDASIAAADLANGSVDTLKILDGTIGPNDFADGAVTSAKILDGGIADVDILTGSISESKLDIAQAPITGRALFWNGTKLDYSPSASPTTTTCSQVLPAFGAHAYSATLTTTMFTDFYGTGSSSPENTFAIYSNPVALSFHHMFVRITGGATAPASTTFTLKEWGFSSFGMSCTILGGQSTCSDSSTVFSAAANKQWNIQSSAPSTAAVTRGFQVSICTSPF